MEGDGEKRIFVGKDLYDLETEIINTMLLELLIFMTIVVNLSMKLLENVE